MIYLLSLLMPLAFAISNQPSVVVFNNDWALKLDYRGPLLPPSYKCLNDSCGSVSGDGYTAYSDGRLTRPDGSTARWGFIPSDSDIEKIKAGVESGAYDSNYKDFLRDYDFYLHRGGPPPGPPTLFNKIGEWLNSNSSVIVPVISLALNHDYASLPPSLVSASDNIERQLQQNQNIRNNYLPNIEEQIEDTTYGMQIATSQNNQQLFNYLLSLGSQLKHLDASDNPQWNSYVVYKLTSSGAEALMAQYLKSLSNADFDSAIEQGEKLLYSNHTIAGLPGFNSDGVFVPEKIDTEIGASPVADWKFHTPKNTGAGQVIRRIANRYQATWANWAKTGSIAGLTNHERNLQFLAGLSFLRQADLEFDINPVVAEGFMLLADSILDHIRGVGDGFLQSLNDLEAALPFLKRQLEQFANAVETNPSEILQASWDLILASPHIAASVGRNIAENTAALYMGSSYERGRAMGSIALNAVITAVTDGALDVTSQMVETATAGSASAQALRSSLNSVTDHWGYENLAPKSFTPLVEQAKEIDAIAGSGVSAEEKVQLGAAYNALLNSGKPALMRDAKDIVKQMTNLDPGSFEVMERVAVSQVDPMNFAPYLTAASDVPKIVESAQLAEKIINNESGSTIDGYVARIQKRFVELPDGTTTELTPEDLNEFHLNSTISDSRIGIGGPDGVAVLSYGMGSDSSQALRVAKREFSAYFPNTADTETVQFVKKVKVDDVLILDKATLKKYGLQGNYFSERGGREIYERSHPLGILAKMKFRGILLRSARESSNWVLHSFTGDL